MIARDPMGLAELLNRFKKWTLLFNMSQNGSEVAEMGAESAIVLGYAGA